MALLVDALQAGHSEAGDHAASCGGRERRTLPAGTDTLTFSLSCWAPRSLIWPLSLSLCRSMGGLQRTKSATKKKPYRNLIQVWYFLPLKNRGINTRKYFLWNDVWTVGMVLLSVFCACHLFDEMQSPYDSMIPIKYALWRLLHAVATDKAERLAGPPYLQSRFQTLRKVAVWKF